MPTPTTTDELLDVIRKSELIPAERLQAFLDKGASRATNPRDLVNQFLTSGLITGFQAEQFLQGKWRGFTIGKYRVLERVGSGGMGTVYLCEHMVVGRKVAVKVLPSSQAENPSALGRFYREARAAGVLDHPNLVKAHDVDHEGNVHFLVMDYVDGSSLQDIVTRSGPLSVLRACHCIRQAARGLQAAHDAGLIHRDVKPANILLERNGVVRVLDLGLARFYQDNDDPLTLKYDEKSVLGTADYVAPEQALNSHEVDIRADVYSLGATFYFLLTGQPPFPGGKIAQKLIWHQVRQPTPVRQLRPEVPESLAALVNKMMAKEVEERFQTPADVVEALAPWTQEPMPRPRDDEMPQLSAAALAGPPPTPAAPPAPRRSSGLRPLPPRKAKKQSGATREPESSGQVITLHRAPSAAELATPQNLGAHTPTDTAHPRPVAVAPSRLLQQAQPQDDAPGSGFGKSLVKVLLMALISGLIGVGLTWWLLMR